MKKLLLAIVLLISIKYLFPRSDNTCTDNPDKNQS